nr:immunoglobulin heavy chain junction region [Macaca mulatta]MOW76059.1 immunoglobulin heavy chain junction region [Macaca mulatta]MOW76797.1 immunoglobulin heavy chain junction region [Macaca mulatta]MOW80307.1 immunoglobulin heavy chain junction region [Macaca mulatta]MOW80625.1 immunoglobulin heavy chain junction region [Macaca mulatta]
CARDHSGYDFW